MTHTISKKYKLTNETNLKGKKMQEEIIRLASLVGTDAKEPEKKLLAFIESYTQTKIDEALDGFKPRQISGFEIDQLGQWWKITPITRVMVRDELLLDSLNVRQEGIQEIEKYKQTLEKGEKMKTNTQQPWEGCKGCI
jgi:hypothetical protein